jgi:hypothetical protein
MKTRTFLVAIFCLTFATVTTSAQTGSSFQTTNQLPYLLDSVVAYGSQNFSKIRGDARNGNIYTSLLTVEGAEKTFIREKTYDFEWVADYGDFKTIEAANSKLEELKQQFLAVARSAQFIEIRPKFSEYPEYVLKGNLPNNCIRFYKAKYCLTPTKKKTIQLEFIVSGKQGLPSFVNYLPVTVAPASNQLAQDLRDLIKESVNRFDAIQGELISDNMIRIYKTTKMMDQALACTIRKPLFGGSYNALMTSGVAESQVEPEFRKVVEKVGAALGSDFFYSYPPSNDGLDFTQKDRLSHESTPDVSVQVVRENDSYSIYILVRQVDLF